MFYPFQIEADGKCESNICLCILNTLKKKVVYECFKWMPSQIIYAWFLIGVENIVFYPSITYLVSSACNSWELFQYCISFACEKWKIVNLGDEKWMMLLVVAAVRKSINSISNQYVFGEESVDMQRKTDNNKTMHQFTHFYQQNWFWLFWFCWVEQIEMLKNQLVE